jgi:hypothetical protein
MLTKISVWFLLVMCVATATNIALAADAIGGHVIEFKAYVVAGKEGEIGTLAPDYGARNQTRLPLASFLRLSVRR